MVQKRKKKEGSWWGKVVVIDCSAFELAAVDPSKAAACSAALHNSFNQYIAVLDEIGLLLFSSTSFGG